MRGQESPDFISQCLSLAMLLEVSGSPKPGNVHRTRNHAHTTFEHFLASAVAAAPIFREAGFLGHLIRTGKKPISSVGIGRLLLSVVQKVQRWQRGGNTVLGTMMLLLPLAVAAGMSITRTGFSLEHLKANLIKVIDAATPDDTLNFFKAIRLSGAGNLGAVNELDVNDPKSMDKIRENRIPLGDALELAADRDLIAREIVTGYRITFEKGFPAFVKEIHAGSDSNAAVVHTFLRLLAINPDSLIARKAGLVKASEVSRAAAQILSRGGLRSKRGRASLHRLDNQLQKEQLNPGSTADLLAASLAIALLNGYRP